MTVNTNISTIVKETISLTSEQSSSITMKAGGVEVLIDSKGLVKETISLTSEQSSSITMKAGGVEVLIDSKGLVVKGGEIKAE